MPVTVSRGIFGDIVVSVSRELWPLSDMLQTDMVEMPELLAEAIGVASEPGRTWGSGGNAYWIEIDGEKVTVSNQVNEEEEVTLPREQFLEILRDFQRALSDLRAAES